MRSLPSGYTMVYGIAKMLNFAHGDVIMVGAFVILTAVTKGGMSPMLAIILSGDLLYRSWCCD